MVDPFKLFWVLTNSTYLVTKFIRTGIADKNDSTPYFDRALYETEVDENENLHHTVLTLSANTHNNYTSNFRYEITGGNIGGAFSVRNRTGDILVAGSLDYETRRKYELRLAVFANRKVNYTTVVIHVRDVNDNPPVFERPTYRTQITEEDDRNLPKKILQVTAIDGDKDRPHNVVYFPTGQGIDTDNPANSKFEVNRTTGEIFVLKPLDRDQPNGRPQWRFTIFAQDEGGDGLVGYSEVQVNLKDINDNAPVFPLGVYFANVTENGTVGLHVMKIAAVDYDDPNEGGNAKLVYSIEKNVIEEETGYPIFEIEAVTGIIKTAVCCLDREKTPDYSIQVVAMDGGGLKGTGTASIKVKDINDMPPHFVKDEWTTEVDETSDSVLPQQPILTVTVHDEDEVNNFTYKIIEHSGYGSNKFEMVKGNDGTGWLKIKEYLDYEDPMQRNGFRFRIQVNDRDGNGKNDKYHQDTSWVVVKLRDINDNQPVFEKNISEVQLFENVKVGKIIQSFRAFDADNGGKSKITYTIDRLSDRGRNFFINDKGSVIIQRPLDREKASRHDITIVAMDDGVPPKSTTAQLIVIVKDVNDNAPTFLKDYRPILPEHVPSQMVAEIYAADKDDHLMNNGPPFRFYMDPLADDIIRSAFKVEQTLQGSIENMAIVSSLGTFDREYQKEYLIPIVIKDSGTPPMIGTSTLTVTIGDINDNKMQPGTKNIFIYNYQGQAHDVDIGKVFVHDADDWDYLDKIVKWDGPEHARFKVNEKTGMLQMRQGIKQGTYKLKFKVSDYKHNQYNVSSVINVFVLEVAHESVVRSGSIRFKGVTDEEFVREWDYKIHSNKKSFKEKLKDKLTNLFKTDQESIDIFSVQKNQNDALFVDIMFTVHDDTMNTIKLNGIVLLHKDEIENHLGINITMVGINECLQENKKCEGSCTNILEIKKNPYLVDANTTALVGVRVKFIPQCLCDAKNSKVESCKSNPCFNGGLCVDNKLGITCSCPAGYSGPRCQQIYRSFQGNGWAWFPSLEMCERSHLSFEFITRSANGIFLYNGPIILPKPYEEILSDFISVELRNGTPRLLIDFGSGTLELKISSAVSLDDGEWHRLDIFWDTENVKMILDYCKSAEVKKIENGSLSELDYANCQAQGIIPLFNEYLNVNTPLQLGGAYIEQFDKMQYFWRHTPNIDGFNGCLKNVVFNSKLYDLAHPGLHQNSLPGCPQTDELCNQDENTARCWYSGSCVASYTSADCKCKPGWTGPTCTTPTIPITFQSQSYVKYALSFEPDRFTTSIQLRFRTRETQGELFRMSDQHSREYCILEIKDSRLHFRYNLNSMKMEENDIWLSRLLVNDGHWHIAKVNRFGSAVLLEMDGGEGIYYNESFNFVGQQWLFIDKQEGVFAGGKAEFTGLQTIEVMADFQKGCLDDIRLDGKQLPLPPAMNGTQWGQATMSRNLIKGCASSTPCINIDCSAPFVCVDLWNKMECRCAEGQMLTHDGRGCVDRNECVDLPCKNGGRCVNQDPISRYKCVCPETFRGKNCELEHDKHTFSLSLGAVAAIFICLLIIFVVVPIFLACNRRRDSSTKALGPEKDVRENVINYDDEGGGEDDMTAFDITTLQIPIKNSHQTEFTEIPSGVLIEKQEKKKLCNKKQAIQNYKKCADCDVNSPPFDDLRNYGYEGESSNAGSLSCFTPDSDEEQIGCSHIEISGERFEKLEKVYNIYQQTSCRNQSDIKGS